MAKIPFKGYCFAVGTTSYRTDKFNLNIERQLEMMSRFRELPENRGISGPATAPSRPPTTIT